MRKIPESIKEFCDKQELVRIGYEDNEGGLHVVPVWFAEVDGSYCFGTEADSLKSRSLLHRPDAGWVIDGGENRKYKGASFSGRAEHVEDKATRAKTYRALGKKYFGSVDHPKFIEIYGAQDDPASTYFRLKPKSVSSWEY
jgi:nitroimidazol reductase NimA-like FMN-containing flavoprotein (pyridoxamine 5'-phosphate oxidase superfamily)